MTQIIRKSNWFEKILSKAARPTSADTRPFWTMSRKLLIPSITVMAVLTLGLIIYIATFTIQRNQSEATRDLTRTVSAVESNIEELQTLALGLATEMASNPQVQTAFTSQDRQLLTEITLPTFEIVNKEFNVKQFQFILPPATSFLRLHQLDKYGDDLSAFRFTVLAANSTQMPVTGIEIGRGGLGVRGEVPVFYQGKYVGIVDIGLDIGPAYLENLKKQYGIDAQILLEKEAAQTATFKGATSEVTGPTSNLLLQASTYDEPLYVDPITYERVLKGEAVVSRLTSKDKTYSVISTPLKDYSGKVIGILEISLDRTETIASQFQSLTLSIVLSLLATLASGFILVRLINYALQPINTLTKAATALASGDLEHQVVVQSNDELGILANTFNKMTARLRDFIATLESRVAERTRNLELAAEVVRSVSQVRALDIMLKDAAELIRSRFDLYYVQVYLTDPSQTNLTLQAGTGTVGAELLGRGHRLPFNSASINGRAAVEKKSVVISDTENSPTFKPNPLLPDTRSEMAVPLLIGDKVVGVLDMQSEVGGSLSTDILSAFEALAGQIAIAIQNATFLAETQQARADVEAQAQRLTRTNWKDYLDAIHKPEETGYVFEQNKIAPLNQGAGIKDNALVTPITVTGEALGNLVVEMEGQSPIARTDELLTTVARQISQQIENLRLLDSAERYRFEAEESSRRLTREGWQAYAANTAESMSYVYDLKEVRAQNDNGDRHAAENGYILPLKVRDETVGRLVVQGMDAGDGESVSLATAVAERLGAHIESLRQFEETQRGQIELDKRAQQLGAVAEISTASSKELDIQKMLEAVVHLTQRKFGLYHAHVFIYNEQTEILKIAACGWKEGDEHEGTHGSAAIPLLQEQSLVARSARNRQAVIVNNVHNEAGWLPNPLLPDTNSEMAIPLISGDQFLGVLDVQAETLNAFTEEDANIYATLASQVSTALQNARSFAKSQQQAERESTLNVISQKIQSATTVEAVLQIAARELGHALGAPMTIAQLSMKNKN